MEVPAPYQITKMDVKTSLGILTDTTYRVTFPGDDDEEDPAKWDKAMEDAGDEVNLMWRDLIQMVRDEGAKPNDRVRLHLRIPDKEEYMLIPVCHFKDLTPNMIKGIVQSHIKFQGLFKFQDYLDVAVGLLSVPENMG